MSQIRTFGYTGGSQQFVVPANIADLRVNIDLKGAGGGGTTGASSAGGRVVGLVNVNPNDAFTVVVGGAGNGGDTTAQFNGGGAGGKGTFGGGSGGGATDVRRGGTALTNRIAVAGGGGGSGRGSGAGFGGQGGANVGANGIVSSAGSPSATGGSQTSGGTKGQGFTNGADGGDGVGGTGGANFTDGAYGGGGGGGGYFGGGGGGAHTSGFHSGSGAGGSNYVGGFDTAISTERGTGSLGQANGVATLRYSLKPTVTGFSTTTEDGAPYDTENNMAVDKTCLFQFSYSTPETTLPSSAFYDFMTAASYRYRKSGDSAWTTVTNAAFTSRNNDAKTRAHTISVNANTFTNLVDATVEVQFKVTNAGINADGVNTVEGDWSQSFYLRPRVRPSAPVWVSSAISTRPPVVTFTTPSAGPDDSEVHYLITLRADSNGSPTGPVLSTAERNAVSDTAGLEEVGPGYEYANHVFYHLAVKYWTLYQNVYSDSTDSGAVEANISASATPLVVVTPQPLDASVLVEITNPDAMNDPFPPLYNRVFRSAGYLDDQREIVIAQRVPVNGSFMDRFAPGNQRIGYRVEAVNATTYTSSG